MLQEKGTIWSVKHVMDGVFKLTIVSPEIAIIAKPGQFVMVKCEDKHTFLRRAFCVSGIGIDSEKRWLNIIFKVIGPGTEWLSKLTIGDSIDILGPLGHGYELVKGKDRKILLVAGDIGVAPLISVAEELVKDKENMPEILILYGCQTLNHLCSRNIAGLFPETLQADSNFIITTEDGSFGHKGLVTVMMASLIHEREISQIYACGPNEMLRKVAIISQDDGIPCQVSLEERMACGTGVCNSCVVKVGDEYKKVCTDGPVFRAEEVNWSWI